MRLKYITFVPVVFVTRNVPAFPLVPFWLYVSVNVYAGGSAVVWLNPEKRANSIDPATDRLDDAVSDGVIHVLYESCNPLAWYRGVAYPLAPSAVDEPKFIPVVSTVAV